MNIEQVQLFEFCLSVTMIDYKKHKVVYQTNQGLMTADFFSPKSFATGEEAEALGLQVANEFKINTKDDFLRRESKKKWSLPSLFSKTELYVVSLTKETVLVDDLGTTSVEPRKRLMLPMAPQHVYFLETHLSFEDFYLFPEGTFFEPVSIISDDTSAEISE